MKFRLILLFFTLSLGLLSCYKTKISEKTTTPFLPTITTIDVTPFASDRAVSGFRITNADTVTFIEKGIVWDSRSLPTMDLSTKASINLDTSSYSFYMTNLNCSTKYFVRSFAITTSHDTIYGNQLEFSVNFMDDPYFSHLILSKTHFIDTIISTQYISKQWPSNGAVYLNNLSLPQGIYMYVKIDSAINLRCENGLSTRICFTGDTMHFGAGYTSKFGFSAQSGVRISPVIKPGDFYYQSEGRISIHIAGIAVTADNTYNCRYYNSGYLLTNTTWQSIYTADTSKCYAPCAFQ